jgi:hypothetical protein
MGVADGGSFRPGAVALAERGLPHAAPAGGHAVRGGGILSRGAEVVGLSNLFGSATDMVWRSLAAMAYEVFPGLPLVGYDRGNELAAAHQAGFETIGPLRVWRLGAPTR